MRRDGPAGASRGAALRVGAASHAGLRRANNQDAYCALVDDAAPPGTSAVVAVADGMGGHRAGEVASALAIEKLVARLRTPGRSGLPPPAGLHLGQLVEQVNRDIYEAARGPDLSGMGTTLTAAALVGGVLSLAHVGDSRAYLCRGGDLRRLTTDHSWIEEQVAAGLLSPAEAEGHPGRHMLTRVLGIAPQVQVDTATLPLAAGDVVLLCSDGLHTLVRDEEIAAELGEEPRRACSRLVQRANARGGADNITAVALRVDRIGSEGGEAQQALLSPLRSLVGRGLGLLRGQAGPSPGVGDSEPR